MASTDKAKQSLYFPEDMLAEMMKEAVRLDRSLSWTVQQAWRIARNEVRRFPSVERPGETAPARAREPQVRTVDAEPSAPSAQVREFLRGKFERELAG